MKLSKEVCKNCVNNYAFREDNINLRRHLDVMMRWNEKDEYCWNNGVMSCPDYGAVEINMDKNKSWFKCKYILEHVVLKNVK